MASKGGAALWSRSPRRTPTADLDHPAMASTSRVEATPGHWRLGTLFRGCAADPGNPQMSP